MNSPRPWEAAIDAFLADQQWNEMAPSTRRLRQGQLVHIARTLGVADPWSVEPAHLVAWASAKEGCAADTRRSYRTTLRAFYEWATAAGHVETSPALRLKRVRPSQPNPRAAPDWVYLSTIRTAQPRERLMMQLAAIQGLRCCEVAVVWPERDLIEDDEGSLLLVHGKGGKERIIPLETDLDRVLRGLPQGYAFPGDLDGHLSAQTVGKVCNRELPGSWTMHKLRHRAGTRFYEACDHDIRLTAAFLGHADTKTTMIYVQPHTARMRAAVNRAAA